MMETLLNTASTVFRVQVNCRNTSTISYCIVQSQGSRTKGKWDWVWHSRGANVMGYIAALGPAGCSVSEDWRKTSFMNCKIHLGGRKENIIHQCFTFPCLSWVQIYPVNTPYTSRLYHLDSPGSSWRSQWTVGRHNSLASLQIGTM